MAVCIMTLIYKEKMMKTLTSFFGMLSLVLMTSCATVGGVWEAGTEVVTGTVDSVVGGAATVTKSVADDVVTIGTLAVDTAQGVVVAGADLGKGVVTTVSDAVDKQTDELQDKEEEAPKTPRTETINSR